MAISGGTRLGPYEVLAFIGAGGMSEVYKARDTRFGRIVAIKVLHEHLAGQADRRARFEREARAISRLNHPTICTLFDAGHDNGIDYVVVEYLEGQSLAERLEKGALPIDQALAIARDVASALDAAHRAGIVHRDVKPANIMLTKTGAKLLDFGVATISMSAAPAAFAGGAEPTLTVAGMLLGTVPYMSPEQLEGREADARSDLFAFGAVIYEMIVGKKAFEGTSQASVIHAILDANPPAMSTVLPQVPPLLDHVVTSCLAKDPDHRWQNANDLGRELKWIADATTVTPSVPSAPPGRRRLAAAVIVLTATTVAGTIGWFAARSMVAPSRVSRLHLIPPSTAALSINTVSRDVALTPDGSRLIYIGANGRTLFVRPLDQLEATPLVSGAGELRDPFVSPDGQWVGFFDGGQALKKVPLTGGHAVLVARLDTLERGATFAADGSIIFATSATAIGLQRVSAGGGAAAILTRPDRDRGEANHWWPEVLPGGQTVLYTATETTGGLDAASIAVLDLKTGRSTILLRGGTHAHYAASGHLVFAAGGMLRAVGFDRTHLMTVGTSIPVVPQVLITSVGAAEAAMALDGTLAYVAGSAGSGATRTLVWVDRQGHETPLAAPLRGYLQNPRVSPDGTRVAVADYGQNPAIWLWDLARATLVRLTFDSAFKQAPLWTSNSRVVFDSNPTGTFNLFSRGGRTAPARPIG